MIVFMIHNLAWSSGVSKLCLSQEKVLFACDTEGGKSIYLCAGEMNDWSPYLQYRFGDSPQNGLFFPPETHQSLKKFTYEDSSISFVHDELKYEIIQPTNPPSDSAFGGVKITALDEEATEVLRIPCTSQPQGELSFLEHKIGFNPTQNIFDDRLRGFVNLELHRLGWGPIPIYESAYSSKRSKDTLSFELRVSTQRKYRFRYVGQSGMFFDEVRFVGWEGINLQRGTEEKKQIEATENAIPFSFRENPDFEDIFWIRKTDLHPLFLKRKGMVNPHEPWLCCTTISFYASSALKRKRGEITVEEVQQDVMQLVWRQIDRQEEHVITLDSKDIQEVGYEVVFLNYFDIKNERIQILNHSHPDGLWLPTKNYFDYKNISLEAFLAQKQEALFPEIYDNVHLYSQPNYQPENLLHTLRNDRYIHLKPTGDFVKGWFEVIAEEYTGPYSCGGTGESTGRIWNGWIPTLLPNGEPTVWFYTRGC
jgi:hypothetical protein